MTPFTTLIAAIAVALAASTFTVVAIHGPLRRQLNALCTSEATSDFWTRAAVTVLYLLPLFIVLVFGLPDLTRVVADSPAEIARRTIAAAAFSLAAIVIGIGLRLAGTRRVQLRSSMQLPPRRYPEREGL